jgi:hypothetical protein
MFIVKVTYGYEETSNYLLKSGLFNYIGVSHIDNCPMYRLNESYSRLLKLDKLLNKNKEQSIKDKVEYIVTKVRLNTVIMTDEEGDEIFRSFRSYYNR